VIPRVTLLAALGNVPTTTMPIAVIEPISIIPNSELDETLASVDPTASAHQEGASA
jgi:glycine betaine/proline transport system ATP-binding protein